MAATINREAYRYPGYLLKTHYAFLALYDVQLKYNDASIEPKRYDCLWSRLLKEYGKNFMLGLNVLSSSAFQMN